MSAPEFIDLGFARMDVDRLSRTGDPEVVYGAGKTPEQVTGAMRALRVAHPDTPILATRLSDEAMARCADEFGADVVDPVCRVAVVGPARTPVGTVAIACGGTSDLPVARECAATVAVFGARPTSWWTWVWPACTDYWPSVTASPAPTWSWRSPGWRPHCRPSSAD